MLSQARKFAQQNAEILRRLKSGEDEKLALNLSQAQERIKATLIRADTRRKWDAYKRIIENTIPE